MQRFKQFDKISTVPDDFRIRTNYGGLVTISTVLIIIALLSSEIAFTLTTSTRTTLAVSSTLSSTIPLQFDITFPKIPCSLLFVDAMDNTNQQPQSMHLDVEHHIYKRRVGPDGKPLPGSRKKYTMGGTFLEEGDLAEHYGLAVIKDEEGNVVPPPGGWLGGDVSAKSKASKEVGPGSIPTPRTEGADGSASVPIPSPNAVPSKKCGDCYGAAASPSECCSTCEDVKRAYRRKGWQLKLTPDITQCSAEYLKSQRAKGAFVPRLGGGSQSSDDDEGSGCNVYGNVELAASGGNLHFAPGRSIASAAAIDENSAEAFAAALQDSFVNFNVSHGISSLHFGETIPTSANQLDGYQATVDDGHAMFQYYVTVIPTTYAPLRGPATSSYQFSVTTHSRHVAPGSNRGLPGVYFFYEVSPLAVVVEERRGNGGWVAAITSVAIVVGGVVAFMQGVDRTLFEVLGGGKGAML